MSPEQVYNLKEIEAQVDLLEDEYRIPFEMHNEGFKYKEIAEELFIILGARDEYLNDAMSYINVIFFGTIFFISYFKIYNLGLSFISNQVSSSCYYRFIISLYCS